MTVRSRILAVGTPIAVAALAIGVATGVAGQESEPQAPVPRVCWWSDYENVKLSNKCEYRDDERRWYMDVEGEMLPADEQQLPPANLCLYFHGTVCPERKGRQ